MASTDDSAAYWSRLEAPEHGEANLPRRQQCGGTRTALLAIVMAASVGTTLFLTSARPRMVDERTGQAVSGQQDQDQGSIVPYSAGQTQMEQPVAMAEFLKIASIGDFNQLLATSTVADATELYKAMSTDQLQNLFIDFLQSVGSQIPNIAGPMLEGHNAYKSQEEHDFRFEVFKKNILVVLQYNADECKANRDTTRARYGITVHADFTEDEFKSTRLNLLAANHTSLFEAANNFPKVDGVASEHTNDDREAPVDKVANVTALAGAGGMCDKQTGGTCLFLKCDRSRGAQCYEGHCICIGDACHQDGRCVRPGGCEVAPDVSCIAIPCGGLFGVGKGAKCIDHTCICPEGTCAENWKCVPRGTPAPTPVPRNGFGCTGVSDVTTTFVRQQGRCGDCWAFSTVEQLRYMARKKYKTDLGTMSVQYLVDCVDLYAAHKCDEGVKGCCGGLPFMADRWLKSHSGVPTQADYGALKSDKNPFTAYQCHAPRPGRRIKPTGLVRQYLSENAIASAYCSKGPVSIAIAANSHLQHYTGGVMTADTVPAGQINHAVLYVGVDTQHDNDKPVHVLLNSWGNSWGVSPKPPYNHVPGSSGHFLFRFGENTGNIKALATAPDSVEIIG